MTNKTELSRNPSFTPSPGFRDHINSSKLGTTATLNQLFDRYSMMIELDAIRLTQSEQQSLAEHLMGVFIDEIAIQSISQDVIETDDYGLIAKMEKATFGQVLATLSRYKFL
jgi:hypothetical protein